MGVYPPGLFAPQPGADDRAHDQGQDDHGGDDERIGVHGPRPFGPIGPFFRKSSVSRRVWQTRGRRMGKRNPMAPERDYPLLDTDSRISS